MKKMIRNCIFETNSSATHSIVIMPLKESKEWEGRNKYYYQKSPYYSPFKKIPEDDRPKSNCLYTQDEVLNFLKLIGFDYNTEEGSPEDFIRECDCDFLSYDMWNGSEYLEYEDTCYTTPQGEDLVIYCKYGYDG